MGRQQRLAAAGRDGGMQHDLRPCGLALHQLTWSTPACGPRIEVAAEGDEAVLADRPQRLFGYQIRSRRQRLKGHVVAGRPLSGDLLVGPVGLGPSLRDPGDEGRVHLLEGGNGSAGRDMFADDEAATETRVAGAGQTSSEGPGRRLPISALLGGSSNPESLMRSQLGGVHRRETRELCREPTSYAH